MAWPSKDPTDYRAPAETDRRAPRWVAWLWADSGVPYHVHFFVGVVGVLVGLAILDTLLGGLACGLLAQAILDLAGRDTEPD
jgi:hypothetical protein